MKGLDARAVALLGTFALAAACSRNASPSATSPSATPPSATAPESATTTDAPTSTTATRSTTTSVAAPPSDPAGAGDPYFAQLGNGGYDVVRYDVAISADPSAGPKIALHETITATATARLASFHVDLAGMDIASITVDGTAATFRREGDELIVTPQRVVDLGTTFVSVFDYAGSPQPLADAELTNVGWLHAGGATFVVSEPNGAHSWLASSDHLSDKATFGYRIDVPVGVTAVANGRLVAADTVNGRTTWVWDEPDPMATYLATVAIGSFSIVDGGTEGPVHIRNVVPTTLESPLRATFARTGEMLRVLANLFGPYPFGEYGALVIDARLGYALETQTLSLFDRQIALSSSTEEFQVHELAHQWFGDSVTPRSWRDIWLNEGFATYAESLWRERTEPGFDIDAAMRRLAGGAYPPIGNPGAAHLFDKNVYDRGALTLHALRRTVGDDAFFRVLRAWTTEFAHANASTDDFMRLASRVSGRDVSPLLDAWINADPMPSLP